MRFKFVKPEPLALARREAAAERARKTAQERPFAQPVARKHAQQKG